VLRAGSQLVRQAAGPTAAVNPDPSARSAAAGAASPAPAPALPLASQGAATSQDLDGTLRSMLASLKQGTVQRDPSLVTARAAVGTFTEEGKPFGSPLGALLQDQVARLVDSGYAFSPAPPQRGLTVRQIAGVSNPNDPQTQGALLGGDLAILGTYRLDNDVLLLRMSSIDARGRDLAQEARGIARRAIPGAWPASAPNAPDTSQLLNTLGQLGPRAQGAARVEVTTNRPGAGASFRTGEEIRYLVTSTVGGYLYLFHVDAEKRILRIFPNQLQPDPRVTGGAALEVPGPGAQFKFEASPPFGLETTIAIVTPVPLDDRDFVAAEGFFAKPRQEVPELLTSRGIRLRPTDGAASGGALPGPAAVGAPSGATGAVGSGSPAVLGDSLVWNYVTVLIRP
jgi:Domain of unknown function (DUF4384)